ncbi:5-histidylcysteine sulfoxide synthase [Thalassotalea castellviae]|uniref:5-histidylcysteine sulfoxide synthase n=1 Tax=Thalassotalea castellviae TaxID=3075612 RepID=A0ABU2ZZK7_9GAMM|nr:5-histidylcysteine sulfoxide synthase [Thalassotalea sp. W431]MDT0603048.1 5-histidylcysteine sulfoxide synthase [Thalassotalea sp. W431]
MNSTLKQLTTPLLIGEDVEQKRLELKNYFANTWQTYESLFALINDEKAYYLRPERLRHPLIFYYGHTATFFINKLILGKYLSSRLNEKLEAVCAVGVDEMSWDDLDSNHYQWPTLSEVKNYRQQVFTLVNQLIDSMELILPISQDSLAWVILMGCEHERIHLETSSVIMRMLPLKYLSSTSHWLACKDSSEPPENELRRVLGRTLTLGKADDDYTYGWDNEYGQLTIEVSPFKASKYLVSNQEFLQFVEAGGYQTADLWNEEGKQWLSYTQAKMPRFWLKRGNDYWQRNLLAEIPLPLNWPVEVNYLEANAFCHWKDKQTKGFIRLPTEAEWYCLREDISPDRVDRHAPFSNINLAHYASSCPVDRFEHQGFYDVIGNVWQWTESAIDGFDGFKVHPLYDDFSTPTFDGQHNLIKGGSWISTGNETIKSSRYAFRRHFFQHAGFRYVESDRAKTPITPVNPIETDKIVCQQLASHYPHSTHHEANFSVELANVVQAVCREFSDSLTPTKLLNLGCSVGRAAFELSAMFDHIDAVDFSARFIQYGVKLQNNENVRYQSIVEGDIVNFNEVALAQYVKNYRGNVHFSQGDAVNLKPIFQGYDVVLLQQVLEQSYDPKAVLENIAHRLNKGALLIVATNNTFNEQVTQKDKWLGGVKINGENVTVLDGISQVLMPNFNLVTTTSLQQTLAINAHQTQQSCIMISVWQLKNG